MDAQRRTDEFSSVCIHIQVVSFQREQKRQQVRGLGAGGGMPNSGSVLEEGEGLQAGEGAVAREHHRADLLAVLFPGHLDAIREDVDDLKVPHPAEIFTVKSYMDDPKP